MAKNKRIIGEEQKSQLHTVTFSSGSKIERGLKSSQTRVDELESYKKLRKRRTRIACYRMAIWLVVILLLPVFVFLSTIIVSPSKGHNFFGYTMYIIVSESMTPEIKVNDLIIVKSVSSEAEIEIGDDITFIRPSDGQTVTHRVIDITNENGQTLFATKGIHNTTMDETRVALENIVGKRVRTVGWLGQTIMFFRTPLGLTLFMAMFIVIVLGFYLSFRISDDIRAVSNRP